MTDSTPAHTLSVLPLPGMPPVHPGDDLAAHLLTAVTAAGQRVQDGDVLVVSSKIAAKAAGLSAPRSQRAAVIARDTRRVVAERSSPSGTTRVVESAAGPVMAAAGVDGSNTGSADLLLTLPPDPDAVSRSLRAALIRATGVRALGLVLSDTAGRPWRAGVVDFALGAAGLHVVDDLRGRRDADGRELEVTVRAVADEIAAAADLVKGKTSSIPAAVVRGLPRWLTAGADDTGARSLVRVGSQDWFWLGPWEAVRAALGVEPGSPQSEALGLRPLGPEPPGDRIARAVAVALAPDPSWRTPTAPAAHVEVVPGSPKEPTRVTVRCADPLRRGALVTRLLAALRGERLEPVVRHADEQSADLTVRQGTGETA